MCSKGCFIPPVCEGSKSLGDFESTHLALVIKQRDEDQFCALHGTEGWLSYSFSAPDGFEDFAPVPRSFAPQHLSYFRYLK
jgi:hypothetical protein